MASKLIRSKNKLQILITAGPTREYIDTVRYISNASSGKMGYALTTAALKAGHDVKLITAGLHLKTPAGAKIIKAESAADMFKEVRSEFPKCDCLIMAAAVADFSPARSAKTKIKKSVAPVNIKLKPTGDILKWAGRHKTESQLVVGFALEDVALKKRAQAKLKEKNIDMIIANDTSAINSDKSAVSIMVKGKPWIDYKAGAKRVTAERIIKKVENLLKNKK